MQNFFISISQFKSTNRLFGKDLFMDMPFLKNCCHPEKDGNEVFTANNPSRIGILGNNYPIGKKEEGCCPNQT